MKLVKATLLIFFLYTSFAFSANQNSNEVQEINLFYDKYFENKKPQKGNAYKPFKRWQDFWKERLTYYSSNHNFNNLINKNLNLTKISKEIYNYNKHIVNNTKINKKWEEFGPFIVPENKLNIPSSGIGRSSVISINPKNHNHILLGSACGGMWESKNKGNTWEPIKFTQLLSMGISEIVFSSTDSNLIYAITGDVNGIGLTNNYSIGIIKSYDGGKNWDLINDSILLENNILISNIYLSKKNTNQIIVGTNNGIYFSNDDLKTYHTATLNEYYIRDLLVNENNENEIIASVIKDNSSSIFFSKDNGISWINVLNLKDANRIALAKSYFDNSVFAIASSNFDGSFYGFYKSIDFGNNWTMQSSSPNILGYSTDGGVNGGQGQYDLCIEASIFDKNTIYIGGINLWKTTDLGKTWKCLTHWAGMDSLPYVHADHHYLKFSKNDKILYSCNDGGVYKSLDSGNTWEDISNGLSINQIYRFDANRLNINKVISGTQDNGTLISNDLNWIHIFGGDGMACKFYTDDEKYVLLSLNNGAIYKSTNYGLNPKIVLNQSMTGELSNWISEIEINPVNEKSSYIGYENIWKSEYYSDPNTFTKVTNFNDKIPISNILVNSKDTNQIFISKNNILLFSNNNFESWDTVAIFESKITDIAIDSNESQSIYICLSGFNKNKKIYKFKFNDTKVFIKENISLNLPNIPINSIVCDYSNSNNIVYIGTDIGVFWLNSITNTWERYGKGIPAVIVNQLQVHKQSNKLLAGTFGRGLWKCDLIKYNNSLNDINIKEITICENDSIFIQINNKNEILWNDGFIGNKRYLSKKGLYYTYYYDNNSNLEFLNKYNIQTKPAPAIPIIEINNDFIVLNNALDYSEKDNFYWFFNDSLIAVNVEKIELLKNNQKDDYLSGIYSLQVENINLCKSNSNSIYSKSNIIEHFKNLVCTQIISKKTNLKLNTKSFVSNIVEKEINIYDETGKIINCNFNYYNDILIIYSENLPVGLYYIQLNSEVFCKLLIK